MLSDDQISEFAERGYLVIPQVVPENVLYRAGERTGALTAADPPPDGKHGPHFYFLDAGKEPALLAPFTESPAFGLAEELTGQGTLEIPGQVQVALNIPPFQHRPGIPHIDASNPEPVDDPDLSTFTLLAGVLLTDQVAEDSGNLWVWPGTHLAHAAHFRAHGPDAFCAYPKIDLPEPVQVTGRAGDLLLAHYLLGHNIGGNFASDRIRCALYYRVSARSHASRRERFLQDAWLDYEPVKALAGG